MLGSLRSVAWALRPGCALATSRALRDLPALGPPLIGLHQGPASHLGASNRHGSEPSVEGMGWPSLCPKRTHPLCVILGYLKESGPVACSQGCPLDDTSGWACEACKGGCNTWLQAVPILSSSPLEGASQVLPSTPGRLPCLATSAPAGLTPHCLTSPDPHFFNHALHPV